MRWRYLVVGVGVLPLLLIGTWHLQETLRRRPAAYLDFALDAIEREAVRVPAVDWDYIRTNAERMGRGATTAQETYPAIRFALNRVDPHSFLVSPYDSRLASAPDFGLRVLHPERVVYKVFPGSPAHRAGIQVGDRIESIDGHGPVADPRDGSHFWVRLPETSVRLIVRCRDCISAREIRLGAGRYDKAWTFPPRAYVVDSDLAYVEVPSNETVDPHAYARQLGEAIRSVAPTRPCGWVVDLRRCGGGNMWPMLQPVRGILGEGNPGFFVGRADRTPWENLYKSGEFAGTEEAVVKSPSAVAVLTSRLTNSAGESVAIAFRGRPSTRSFGEATRGRTTANRPVSLPDGIILWVSVAHQADRNGFVYLANVMPDEAMPIDWQRFATRDDPLLVTAIAWLRRQPECRNQIERATSRNTATGNHTTSRGVR